MAKPRTSRRNFLGFGGKKVTHSSKLLQDAYEAGRRSGDTSEFKRWVSQHEDLHGGFKKQLETRYRAGVHSLLEEEKRDQKAAKKRTLATEKAEKQEEKKKQGKIHGRYRGVRLIKYSDGRYALASDRDTKFDNLHEAKRYVDSELKSNPAKFDRCVSKVSKSLKKAKRPGNAYAICTASGARNPFRVVDTFKTEATARAVAKNYPKSKVVKRPDGKYDVRVKAAVKRRNYQSRVWTGKQGGAVAEVYKTGKSSFEVELTGPKGQSTTIPASSFGGALSIARVKLHELASNPREKKVRAVDIVPGASYADTLVEAGQQVYKGVSKSARGLLKKAKAHVSGKRNPIDQAMKMYEDFHGMPSQEVLEITEQEHIHSVKVGIGLLVNLKVNLAVASGKQADLMAPGFAFHKGDGGYWTYDESTPLIKRVLVTSSEDGKQLFLDGGDQSIPDSVLKDWGFEDRDKHDHMVIGELKEITYRTQKSFDKGETVDYYHELGKEGSGGMLPTLLYYPRSKHLKIAGGRYFIAPPDRSLGASPGIVG